MPWQVTQRLKRNCSFQASGFPRSAGAGRADAAAGFADTAARLLGQLHQWQVFAQANWKWLALFRLGSHRHDWRKARTRLDFRLSHATYGEQAGICVLLVHRRPYRRRSSPALDRSAPPAIRPARVCRADFSHPSRRVLNGLAASSFTLSLPDNGYYQVCIYQRFWA